ncbi:hypothetical protein UlMin_045797 [Ulmus minor]
MDYYGKRLATASSDNTIKITGMNESTSEPLATLSGHRGPVWQVAWAHSKFGSLLASCSYDGRVIIWREDNNQWKQARGNSVFSLRSYGVWETSKIDQAHPVGVTSVSWAPGGLVGSGLLDPVQKICSGGCDNNVKVWKLNNGVWEMDSPALQMHTDWVRHVAWAPNLGLPKSTIASALQDGRAIIWTAVWKVSWSLTGNILAVADGSNNAMLWKGVANGEWEQFQTIEP